MKFYGLFLVANQKPRKAIDNVRVIMNKIHFVWASLWRLLLSFIPGI